MLCTLKRPANINVSKAAIKESKLPKFQVSKPGSCSMTTNSKSTMPGPCPLQNKKISDPGYFSVTFYQPVFICF